MKAVIFNIKRFAVHDGPGVRTTIFFKGCPLNCKWCHNPESKNIDIEKTDKYYKIRDIETIKTKQIGKFYQVKELVNEVKKDIVIMEESAGGVTFSGGEPLMQFDFLKEILIQMKETGLHTAVDTSGYVSEKKINEIIPYTDLFLYDLKHYNNEKHIENTGVSLLPILKNLKYILNLKKNVWIRIPIIPEINNSEEDIYGFIKTLDKLPEKPEQINLLPYHNIADNKFKRLKIENKMKNIPGLDKKTIIPFKLMLEQAGFKVKIGG